MGVTLGNEERRTPIGIWVVIGGGIMPESISCLASTLSPGTGGFPEPLAPLQPLGPLAPDADVVSMKPLTSTRGTMGRQDAS